MNMKKGMIVVAAVFALAACGGSGSSTDTGGTGTAPAATSAKTVNNLTSVGQFGQEMFTTINDSLAGAGVPASVKAAKYLAPVKTTATAECAMVDENSFTCTVNDGLGGTCDVTGDYSDATAFFTVTLDCVNFQGDCTTTIDGSFAMSASMNEANFPSDFAAMTAKTTGEDSTDTDCDATCDVEDEDTTFGEDDLCSEGGTCAEAAAFFIFDYTIGDEGLTIVDECGTFEWGANTTWDMLMCAETSDIFTVTFNAAGTFQGSSIDETFNVTCDFSSVSGM